MKKVKITQVKSAIGYKKNQKETVKSLGLGKLHRTVVHNATPQIMGMINTVKHLVEYEAFDEELEKTKEELVKVVKEETVENTNEELDENVEDKPIEEFEENIEEE